MSTSTDPPPPSDLPPPDYAPSQPQILIAPLPDTASFFWGRTVQGEVYVKGLGEGRGNRIGIVKTLSIQLSLTNHLPHHPTLTLHEFPNQIQYPPIPSSNVSSSTPSEINIPFPTSHRFSIPLPSKLDTSDSNSQSPLPGTLNLSSYDKGEIRYALTVQLALPDGQVINEEIKIEGTPQRTEIYASEENNDGAAEVKEVEEKLEKDGVLARLLIDQDQPRLGELLRLGVEIRPVERKKTGVIGLSSQPNPIDTLRPLRRVRVELFRKVIINPNQNQHSSSSSSTSNQASSSTITSTSRQNGSDNRQEHLTLLHASGKSLRYPGSGRKYPPLRVLFTIPTLQVGVVAEQIWGEITSSVPYHITSFFIRVTIGFGDVSASKDWNLTKSLVIRPKKWREPREIVIDRGMEPYLGTDGVSSPNIGVGTSDEQGGDGGSMDRQGSWSEEDYRKEAYRQKGRDVVGSSGTFRNAYEDQDNINDLPPPFESHQSSSNGQAGPSSSSSTITPGPSRTGELPSFLESEEQARTGEIPILNGTVKSERLVPVNFERDSAVVEQQEETPEFDRNNWVGRRGSLGGELGTWVEYDGYETFSVAPPSMDASYGAGGSMDPPQEGDDSSVNLVGGMVARLGLEGEGVGMQGLELMEHLGLGEGTRIVDLQDDLPPGIDEPSLPALPDFHSHSHSLSQSPPPIHADYTSPPPAPHDPLPHAHDPPSFDASQAANAVGGVATSHIRPRTSGSISSTTMGVTAGVNGLAGGGRRSSSRHNIDDAVGVSLDNVTVLQGEAPPGYERAGAEAGLPPYS
ncbi:uncharacterized protein IL334_001250 [Kwoniella shivajii]|uniref:Arrestin C-terminal-like domain-containing protein n=1 Tax=Kwoniella shivajii TaxID=564305 RepID=A0ABZ1CS07_9TREE|nr:hypothetical protein IL334_001250 [Kwoniella shivajii]